MNIHFICRGNVLRSLIAETYVKSLNLKDVNVMSSGTNVDWSDQTEREYFSNTRALLEKHGIQSYAKSFAEQLTQRRADNQDITVCMNQRVVDEAAHLVSFSNDVINWNIVDIGEEDRTEKDNLRAYEEEIYQEIATQVDKLLKQKLPSANHKRMKPKKTEIIDGFTIKYHANGKTVWSKGKVVDGATDGYWEWYRPDGTLKRSGYFAKGEVVGEWTTYDKAGKLYKVTNKDK